MENQALLGHDCAGTRRRRIGGHLIHEFVVVARIVMEDDQVFTPAASASGRPPATSNAPNLVAGNSASV